MLKQWRLPAVLVLFSVLAACGEDDPSGPGDDDDDDPDPIVFTYVPATGGPDITAIAVRGSFNNWGDPTDLEMTEQNDGTWRAEIVLDPGTYQYKYYFNGTTWADNMCADGTWGNPPGGPVSPQSDTCVGGFNDAQIVVTAGD